MKRRSSAVTGWVAAALLSAVLSAACGHRPARAAEVSTPAAPLAAEAYTNRIRPFLAAHCIKCHGPEKAEGKLRLDVLGTEFGQSDTDRHWIEVMDRINLGEMPPEKEPRPDVEAARAVTGWIAAELRQAARKSLASGGRVVLRRLNRTEYANTVRDLLGINFLPGESPLDFLPPDGTAEGFDKVGKALMVDPSLMDKYYEVAARIAERAIVSGPPEFPTHKKRFEFEDIARNGAIKYLCSQPGFQCREQDVVVMEGGARSYGVFRYPNVNRMIPTRGMYTVRVRAAAFAGERGTPLVMRVIRGDERLLETEVLAPPEAPQVYEVTLPLDAPGGEELQVNLVNISMFTIVNAGAHQIEKAMETASDRGDFGQSLRLRGRMSSEGFSSSGRPNPATADLSKLPKLYLDWIELEGPIYDSWPPRSHQIVFFAGEGAAQDLAYARAIFQRLLPRAWRRPVDEAEVEPLVRLVRQELDNGRSYESAIRAGLIAALASPKFLYLAEPAGEMPRPLTAYELAARLSYFLWSSMPDAALSQLAAKGDLSRPEALEAEVERMLADPKSRALVDGFGAQWLRVNEFRTFAPDKRQYPAYDDKLGAAMVQETLRFFEEVLREDRSALDFIDSDWTMVNERLAKFYGIADVSGETFRRVKLPAEAHRGGLLGHAGVMMLGSDGTRTKPVRRGVYVREVLFNDPPDPPPPNVGEIEPNIQGKNLTVRERLLAHQQIASCAACHRTIDPYGLALENFDVIGAWRTQQTGENFRGAKTPAIDASGRLPNGKPFDGPGEFKRLLMEQKERFSRALVEKMLTYALGRPMEPSDRGAIDELARQMPAQNYSLRKLIRSIVTTDVFRTK